MLEILEFIFQDFWHWLGTLLLVSVPLSNIGELISITVSKKRGK